MAVGDNMFKGIDTQILWLVLLGGMVGGLLQPVVSQLNPAQANATLSNWIFGPFLGAAAAGITVFVVANSKTEDKIRLLFFSLLCGLAFPALLTSAVEGISQDSQNVADKANEIAVAASNQGSAGMASDTLTRTMLENPAENIDNVTVRKLESVADGLVTNLAEEAKSSEDVTSIESLKAIGTAAKSSGYNATALRVTEVLSKLEANTTLAPQAQDSAAEAADAVIGVEQSSQPPP